VIGPGTLRGRKPCGGLRQAGAAERCGVATLQMPGLSEPRQIRRRAANTGRMSAGIGRPEAVTRETHGAPRMDEEDL
jgi:hypothetical protein